MKRFLTFFPILCWTLLSIMVCNPAYGEESKFSDRTLSPYFFVNSEDPDLDCLPLKTTSTQVDIAGVIADVRLTQVYRNDGKKPLEAIYIFPASSRAAVYGMKMSIGERTIIAEVHEREQARREYEQARDAGQSASLLEQQRPNVFQMNVANILPNDVITVELRYTELLVPTDGVYEFVYPTVVGPRYSNQSSAMAPPSEHWVENPYMHQGQPPTYAFDIKVNISAGLPIRDILCPTHKTNVKYDSPGLASIDLDSSEKHGGNRDFIIKYRLAGGEIESGLLLYEGEEENFFLLMLQPPKRVSINQIPAREYIFIVDVSGSMHGFPLEISKKLLKDLIGSLRPVDSFNLLLFAGGSTLLSERSLPASADNIRKAIDAIERQRGGGGTELLPALERALALPGTEGCSRTVVIATDGYVTVEEEAFDLIRGRLGDANMFAFGIGSSVNRYLIEGMARAGMGEPFIITKPDEASSKAEHFRKIIASPVLTQIKVNFGEFEAYDVEPPSIPDVLAERPVIVFGKWKGRAKGKITVQGMSGNGEYFKRIRVDKYKPLATNSSLKYLWARHRIAILGDYNRLRPNDERVKEITELGLRYNLLTAYTSFVAIDSIIRMENGKTVTVKQPLPLPQGVSDYAVGNGKSGNACRMAPSLPMSYSGSVQKEALVESETWSKNESRDEDKIGKTPGKALVRIGEISGGGAVVKKEIRAKLERNLDMIGQCLSKQVKGKYELKLQLTVDAKGKVLKISVIKTDLPVDSVTKCVIEKIKQIRLPATADKKTATVIINFIFE